MTIIFMASHDLIRSQLFKKKGGIPLMDGHIILVIQGCAYACNTAVIELAVVYVKDAYAGQ